LVEEIEGYLRTDCRLQIQREIESITELPTTTIEKVHRLDIRQRDGLGPAD